MNGQVDSCVMSRGRALGAYSQSLVAETQSTGQIRISDSSAVLEREASSIHTDRLILFAPKTLFVPQTGLH